MHKARVKQFEGVAEQLSFQHYPGLVRSIQLERANALRDIFDVKQAQGWPLPKVRPLRLRSAHARHELMQRLCEGERGGARCVQPLQPLSGERQAGRQAADDARRRVGAASAQRVPLQCPHLPQGAGASPRASCLPSQLQRAAVVRRIT